MSHSLPADVLQRIEAQIASGAFTSEADVLREAMESLERRQRGLLKIKQLISAAEDDVAAGRVGTFNRDDIKRDVRSRLAAQGITE